MCESCKYRHTAAPRRGYAPRPRRPKAEEVQVGRMLVTENAVAGGPRWIINFPTKEHWRNPSRMEWVDSGLQDLRRVIAIKGIRSIAISALGCGNGGLSWPVVKAAIEAAFCPGLQHKLISGQLEVGAPVGFPSLPKNPTVNSISIRAIIFLSATNTRTR